MISLLISADRINEIFRAIQIPIKPNWFDRMSARGTYMMKSLSNDNMAE